MKSAGGKHKSKAPKSPKMKHAMKREAERNERKASPSIKDPKASVKEVFEK